jgi:hypothetical protein
MIDILFSFAKITEKLKGNKYITISYIYLSIIHTKKELSIILQKNLITI